MPIRIKNWGGVLIWHLRKKHSKIITKIAFKSADVLYSRSIKKYIHWWSIQDEAPMFSQVMIETMNRCNGECSFCPANIRDEKRPYKKMSLDLIEKIIEELMKLEFDGNIYLNVNNEPFIDVRILDIARKMKDAVPKAKICIITNGTLLTKEKMLDSAKCIDEMIINNYSTEYKLSPNLEQIYWFVKNNKAEFSHIDIVINRRFISEILATRAGNAPNKPKKTMKMNSPCVYPFTDIVIFPDGQIGLCCNDCLETTHIGDINNESLQDVWNGTRIRKVRECMQKGREEFEFCKECDVVDAGSRERLIKERLKKEKLN